MLVRVWLKRSRNRSSSHHHRQYIELAVPLNLQQQQQQQQQHHSQLKHLSTPMTPNRAFFNSCSPEALGSSVFCHISSSGVPRILEWEGSRSYRLRGGIPSPLREGSGEGAVPRKFFVFFVENTIFWRIVTHLFLKPYANERVLTPNPLLSTPLIS